jgi:hypothetical protein
MSHRTTTPRDGRSSGEEGSAYLFVLLGLLVLTIIGLSLVVITQTEAQIGGAERTRTRVFYGADSGLHAQLGNHFTVTDPIPGQFQIDVDAAAGGTAIQDVVDVSAFLNLYNGPCALCSVNVGGERYWLNNYVVNARSKRLRDGDWDTICLEAPQSVKRLSSMYLIQPEKDQGGGLKVTVGEVENPYNRDTTRRTDYLDLIDGVGGGSDPTACDTGLVDIVF